MSVAPVNFPSFSVVLLVTYKVGSLHGKKLERQAKYNSTPTFISIKWSVHAAGCDTSEGAEIQIALAVIEVQETIVYCLSQWAY